MNLELNEMNISLREINLSCEVLGSQSHRKGAIGNMLCLHHHAPKRVSWSDNQKFFSRFPKLKVN